MKYSRVLPLIGCLLLNAFIIRAQNSPVGLVSQQARQAGSTNNLFAADSLAWYETVRTYVNPVLPGDHPDPTLLKVGDDFYHCGSAFHFTPYLPIYHSKDLVHWQTISRVLPPSKAAWVSDRPSTGVWQGAITYFYGSYWIYFLPTGNGSAKPVRPKAHGQTLWR